MEDSIRIFDLEGNLKSGLMIENDKLQGVYRRIDLNTGGTYDEHYEDGVVVKTVLYRKDGSLINETFSDYDANEFISKWYYENGKLKTESKSKLDDVTVDIYRREYDEEGNLTVPDGYQLPEIHKDCDH